MENHPEQQQQKGGAANQVKKQKQMLDRRQLMLNLRRLQLQRKTVQRGGSTDMMMQTQSYLMPFGTFIAEGGLARAMDKARKKILDTFLLTVVLTRRRTVKSVRVLRKISRSTVSDTRKVSVNTSMPTVKLVVRFHITRPNLIRCRDAVLVK